MPGPAQSAPKKENEGQKKGKGMGRGKKRSKKTHQCEWTNRQRARGLKPERKQKWQEPMDKKWDRGLTKNGGEACLKMDPKPRPKMEPRSDQKWNQVLTKNGAQV